MSPYRLLWLTVILIVALSGTVQASSWELYAASDGGGDKHFVDRDSIRERDGLVRYSVRTDHAAPKQSLKGALFTYVISGNAADCQDKSFAITSIARYAADRALVEHVTIPRERWKFTEVPPDSVAESELSLVCSHVRASSERTTPPPKRPPASPPAAPQQSQQRTTSSGSGFAIDRQGTIVTNQHVVKGCRTYAVRQAGKSYPAQLIGQDARFDLAILRTEIAFPEATLRNTPIAVGETIYVAGFPLAGVLSEDMNFTNGVVASGAGIGSNFTQLQITAPVQQGNSGGPLLDQSGNVVGVVVGKLDAIRVAGATGDIPQNVNFAIKVDILRMFLDANRLGHTSAASTTRVDAVQIANKARSSTVQVVCQ